MDLAGFLAARLDEDEAAAKATAPSGARYQWRADVQTDDGGHVAGYCVISEPGLSGVAGAWGLERGTGQQVAEHIARHDPARVLRDIEAGRAILARYNDCLTRLEDPDYPVGVARDQAREYEDFVLPNLAAVYSGHPDYDPDWAP